MRNIVLKIPQLFCLLTISVLSLPEARADCFPRFDYCVDIPIELYDDVVYSDNGEGALYHLKDGALISVWGGFNVLNESIKMKYSSTIAGASETEGEIITYKFLDKRYYVVSGFEGEKVFYRMVALGADDIYRSFEFTYPIAIKSQNVMIENMVEQFKNHRSMRR